MPKTDIDISPGPTGDSSRGAGEAVPASFEAALAELESMVANMEAGELTLEQSLAAYKRDIHYADDAELARTHDDLMRFRLARWRYKTETAGAREHLGFLIDDVPDSAAVASDGGHVDVYGYASMAVAALQVQAKRMDALEREVKALREELAKR